MSSMAQHQRDGFDSRIDRIRTGASPNVMGRMEVGPREEIRAADAKKRKRATRQPVYHERDSFAGLLFYVPVALAIGALCFLSGRLAAFHFLSGQGMYQVALPEWIWRIDLWGDVAIAATLALLLGWTLRLNRGMRRTALLFGFAGMMSAEVLVMQQFPEVFERFYTPSYVTATISEPVAFF